MHLSVLVQEPLLTFPCDWVLLHCIPCSRECPSMITEQYFLRIHVGYDKSFTPVVNLLEATLLYSGLGLANEGVNLSKRMKALNQCKIYVCTRACVQNIFNWDLASLDCINPLKDLPNVLNNACMIKFKLQICTNSLKHYFYVEQMKNT